MVAMTFAKTGMVLELANNKSSALTYFACTMSDFSNVVTHRLVFFFLTLYVLHVSVMFDFQSVITATTQHYCIVLCRFSPFAAWNITLITDNTSGFLFIFLIIYNRKTYISNKKIIKLSAISAFETIIKADLTENNEKTRSANVSALNALIVNHCEKRTIDPESDRATFYIQSMFDCLLENLTKIQLALPCLYLSSIFF